MCPIRPGDVGPGARAQQALCAAVRALARSSPLSTERRREVEERSARLYGYVNGKQVAERKGRFTPAPLIAGKEKRRFRVLCG